ncbi:SusC/RagA family TonB-linked outer membrane protein [Phocaeicola sp.]
MKHLFLLLTLLSFSLTAFAQQKVTGKVKDSSGEPIIGASVVVKDNNTMGTITDFDGNFVLDVPSKSVLVISYIGYVTQEVMVNGNTSVNITLKEDNLALDEVVVIGYGTQRKGDVTSAVGSVKSDDFIKGAVKDAGQLIQGKVAGLIVTNPSGDPTSTTSIALRGNTTINGTSTNPLILIDGVPGSLNTVAPEDIESVDVLKDGSAAAIYGSRGTNGVILITTKKAKGDNINEIEYSTYISTSMMAKKLDMCTAADYRQQITDGLRDASWDKGADTDWMDEITRTPLSHVHNLSFRGGNHTTNYILNLNYRSLQGIFKRSDKEEFQGRAEINHNMLDDKLKLNFSIIGNQTNYTSTADGGSYNTYCYRQALIHNPTEPTTNENGSWYENTGIFEYDNPLGRIYESDGKQDISQLRFNGNIVLNPIKELTLKALFSYDKTHQYGGYYETKNHISTLRDGKNGYAAVGGNTDLTKLMELTAQFQKEIGAHNFSLLAGYSYQKTDFSKQYEQNWDFPTDLYSYNNIGKGNALKEGLATQYSESLQTNLIGFFGRLSYSYKNRYLLMASLRHEAASQLSGTKSPWGTFPSVSLGWRITEEPFMQNQKLFNDIKLRAGYGVTGSQPNDSFLGMSMLGYGDYFYYNGKWIQALKPSQNANPDLKWEEKHETNIGLDFSMLDGRISGSVDWYKREIKDLLYKYSVPSPPNLYTETMANVGTMSNKGLEVMLNFIPVQNKNFTWGSTVTFSTNTNKLKNLSNDLYQASSDYMLTGWIQEPIKTESHIVRVGQPIGQIFGFKVIDVDDEGKWIYEDKDGNSVGYDDFNHSFENKKVLGNGLPKYYLGFNNTFRYKKWDLSISMRGAFDFQIINCARMFYENRSRQDWNRLRSAYEPVFGKVQLNSLCAEEFNSYYVENGDYWKIDNITLGYTFKNVCKYVKNIRLYFSSLNTLTITGYKGTDPEVSTSGLNPGYDNRDQYPSIRSFTLGANISF